MKLLDKKILCVDDSRSARRILTKFLEEIGFTKIYLANHGADALDFLKENHVDLIISDWRMPVMDGLELLKHIRASDEYKHIPFAMVTAEALKKNVAMAKDSGVTTIISKPFTTESLAEVIYTVFQSDLNDTFSKKEREKCEKKNSITELTETFSSNLETIENMFASLLDNNENPSRYIMKMIVELSEDIIKTIGKASVYNTDRTTQAKILNIDDVKMSTKIISKHLNKLGFQNVHEENDPQLALEKLNREKFDLILSDMHMPDLLGIDLLRSIRNNPLNRNTPFLMITYDNKSKLLIDAVQSKLDYYIIKPVTISALREKLTLLEFEFET